MIVILLFLPKINIMKTLDSIVQLQINENTYLKDPESTELGKRILQHSILMIRELGFDLFTFKKLGEKIGSNESSIYRYFENKHKLLLYLVSWYWSWLEYRVVVHTFAIEDSRRQLETVVDLITSLTVQSPCYPHIDTAVLHDIMIEEYSKSYLTKQVDRENREGYFEVYKRLVKRLEEMILEYQPDYPHAKSMASLIYDGSLHQGFLSEHFPSITDCRDEESRAEFFKNILFSTLNNHTTKTPTNA